MRMTLRRPALCVVAASAILALSLAGTPPVAVQPAFAEEASKAFDGAWRYQVSCGSCHGKSGEGIYAFGPPLKGNTLVMQAPPPVIISVIQKGRLNRNRTYPDYPGMPSFYYIRAGEAEALVEYLKGGLQQ